MKLRLRVWLAGLALCLFPTLAQAQHFLNQCSHAPIPICADMTPTDAAKIAAANALAGIEYCVPEGYSLDTLDEADEPTPADESVAADDSDPLAGAIDQLASEEPLDVNQPAEASQPSVEVVTEVVAAPAADIAEPAAEEVAEVADAAELAMEEVIAVVESVEPAVEEVAEVVEAAEPAVEEIAEVVEAAEPAVEEIAEVVEAAEPAMEAIAEVVEAAKPAVEEIAEVVEAAEPAVEEIAEVVEVAEPAVEEIAEVVEVAEPAVEEIAEVVEAVEPAVEEIAEVVEVAEPAVEEIVEVVEVAEPAVEEVAEVAEPAKEEMARLMDSPIICTLRDPEEYLPYDLTATDALQWQIFADGIPRPNRSVQIPLQMDAAAPAPEVEELALAEPIAPADLDAIDCGEVEPYASAIWNDSPAQDTVAAVEESIADEAADEAVAEVAPVEVAADVTPSEAATASEEVAVAAAGSLECLLDEVVWQTSDALRPEGWLRSSVQPEAIGERLLSATQYAGRQADSLLSQLAEQLPVQPALVGPPAPAALPVPPAPEDLVVMDQRDTPQVCCPLEDFDCPLQDVSDELEIADAGHDDLEAIDENLQAVLDFVRSIASPFQPRIANGGQETDTVAR